MNILTFRMLDQVAYIGILFKGGWRSWMLMSWIDTDHDPLLSTSLASFLDKRILLLLRDGRKILSVLRSFDQFSNVVVEGASEQVIVGRLYCDIPLGLYVLRGENVVLIGESELDKSELPQQTIRVSAAEIERAHKAEKDSSEMKDIMRKRMGFLDFD